MKKFFSLFESILISVPLIGLTYIFVLGVVAAAAVALCSDSLAV